MTRSERVERRLTQRLDELACALERSGAPARSIGRLLELASVATVHAVALELVSAERAEQIWHRARQEHPVLDEAEIPVLEQLAA